MGKFSVGLIGLLVAILFFALLLTPMKDFSHTAQTLAITDEAQNCTTGVGETTCDLALVNPHFYATTRALTLSETAPGAQDVTANATLGGDQQTLTVASLVAETAYTFEVDYLRTDPLLSSATRDALGMLLVWLPMLGLFAAVIGVGILAIS